MPPDELMQERLELYSVLTGMMHSSEKPTPFAPAVVHDYSRDGDDAIAIGQTLTRIEAMLRRVERNAQRGVFYVTRSNDIDDSFPSARESQVVRYRAAERRYMGHRIVTIPDDDE